MSRKFVRALTGGLAALSLAGCNVSKTSNPLSPSVAGPIPGVNITAPKPLEPSVGSEIPVDTQPLTLVVENAATNGVRPLSYVFEVATDAAFTNKVFVRDGIQPGDGGRTSLRLPDPLATGRTYYWRARAQDGANASDYSAPVNFNVFTPIIIGEPELRLPASNSTINTLRPDFVIGNAPRSGPVGAITYQVEVSDTDSFANKIAVWTQGEQSGQTTLKLPQDLSYSSVYYWHVRATDPTTTGPWSRVLAFATPTPPAAPSPGPGPGGGGNPGGHVPPGPLTEAQASLIIQATGREFPHLLAVFGSEGEAVAAADQLLLRTIWHLQLAGFNAARQRNPSGAISSDKISIHINGAWHCYDIYSLGVAGRATTVQFIEVPLPNPVASGGIAD